MLNWLTDRLETLEYVMYGLVVVEFLLPLALLRKFVFKKEILTNVFIYAVGTLTRRIAIFKLSYLPASYLTKHYPFQIPINAFTVVLCVLAVDFMYYWKHRAEHVVPLLWASHSVHHSSEEFDLSTSFRLPWFGNMFYTGLTWLPLVLLGFSLPLVVVGYQIVLVYQFWIHTRHIGKLGALEDVLNTPSSHRVHHGRNPLYLDKNFGGIFIFWDKLFGTYEKEQEDVRYGIIHSINSSNPIWVNFIGYWRLVTDAWNTDGGGWKKFKSIFVRG